MALNNNSASNLRCEIYNEIDNDGIDEYRFRLFDANDKIVLSSSTRYTTPQGANDELQLALNIIRSTPDWFELNQTQSGRWYFNVVDSTGEVIARRIQYFTKKEQCLAEMARLEELVKSNQVECEFEGVGTGGPCEKDQKVCDLHDQILNSYNTCFPDDVGDMKGEYFCAIDILGFIADFDKLCPEYKLPGVLVEQIADVQTFINNASMANFEKARIAVASIIQYLFELGQCDCGPDLEITKFAAVQSSHLYLQAAGSQGVDSTKGIHLRWMLKGTLADHLPKANYATPGVNFNKNEDYVRIYRSPYIPTKVSIDFKERANDVDNATATWTYTIGGEAFYIYFLNADKYAQVLATINPLTNPIGFLQNYGNEAIEVEHKTELSFSVTPIIQTTSNNSTTYMELLSVEENKLTAPKLASLRTKTPTADINGKKQLSENIRSIRLKVSGGFMSAVEFEFYSNFITAANRKQSWSYIGQYALTKDTGVAHQRLEPSPNAVNGKWRRYNDDAYVNINNYKDKWNGAGVPAENRILNTVDTYIDLSNDPTNPGAIETFLLNDPAASSDPDYDPSDDEFELSNLYVLQLASLDYHVARMLGLGTLDLNTTVFTGQYMYLAEYVTFGDLEDGLGKREVQHLYCSLPTDLSDDRLPIPVDLKEPVPGIIQGLGTENPEVITDVDGYAFDGKTRFLSLFNEDLPEELEDQIFFYTNYEFVSAENTIPVYAGIEYKRTADPNWKKPELPFDRKYYNIDGTVPNEQKNETLSIAIPESGFPLFVHREKDDGWHDYSSYGINWFSRARNSGIVHSIETEIAPTNDLQPPSNLNAVLIRPESPLLLSSAPEQVELGTLTGADKTFIRLTFEYNHSQDLINYHHTINGDVVSGYAELPDAEELFGEDFEIFFRNRVPLSVSGKILSVSSNANPILADIQSDEYILISGGTTGGIPNEVIIPSILGNGDNFVGSVLTIDGENYLIHQVDNTGTYPKFIVFKNDENGFPVELGSTIPPNELTVPGEGGLFLAVENMLTPDNWSLPDPMVSTVLPSPLPNPMTFKVNIDHTTVHREEITINITDGTVETHVQKFRGIYENAFIEKKEEDDDGDTGTPEVHLGLYKITFTGYNLASHSQNVGTGHRVEWYNGVVRIHTQGDVNGPRRELKVIRTENIGTSNDLIVYAADLGFSSDPGYDQIQIGTHQVNYYPGYKTYLFHDPTHLLEETTILPATDEGVRYSIFGLRTHDHGLGFYSKMSQPVLMFAQEIVEPEQPRLPVGGLYATRPDFFGKASYTFTTVYEHKPHSVQFNRASDIQILTSIYKVDDLTGPSDYNVESIMLDIFEERKSVWLQDRWNNFLSWDYTADGGLFEKLPNDATGVRMPLPNSPKFIASINAFIAEHNDHFNESVPPLGTITSLHQEVIPAGMGHGSLELVSFMRDIIFNCFVPLTEIPIIYKYINDASYVPIPKKQVVRDRNGYLLSPNDPDFDMAPMAKVIGTGSPNHETQFTDFGLDGASNAKYFYAVREINMQMKNSPYSPILGPISLVNTAPPSAPEIVKITPVLENVGAGILPAIEVKINGYLKQQNIKKVNIYRATSRVNALSIRTMDMVSEIDTTTIVDDPIWTLRDEFGDLGYVPYGDPLFYKIVVQREVTYEDKTGMEVTKYAPSEASKITMTNIVESSNPDAPDLEYYSTPLNVANELDTVTLSWNKTVHNGTYAIHKMNASGNWESIHEIQSNDAVVQVPLVDTSLASNLLTVEDTDGNAIYHHFKIVATNFAGMISREEKILTIYNVDTWNDIASI